MRNSSVVVILISRRIVAGVQLAWRFRYLASGATICVGSGVTFATAPLAAVAASFLPPDYSYSGIQSN
jgi:hypothetical protein